MSHFITDLDVRRHVVDTSADKRGTWSLIALFAYRSDLLESTIVVPTGFVTDFASVPRVPVAYLLTGGCAHEAAVIHDWLYTTHSAEGKEVSRAQADAVFREAALVGGDPPWRAWLMWVAVRVGGARGYDAAGQRQPEFVAKVIDAAQIEAP